MEILGHTEHHCCRNQAKGAGVNGRGQPEAGLEAKEHLVFTSLRVQLFFVASGLASILQTVSSLAVDRSLRTGQFHS